MADTQTEIDLDSVIDRLLEGESPSTISLVLAALLDGWEAILDEREGWRLWRWKTNDVGMSHGGFGPTPRLVGVLLSPARTLRSVHIILLSTLLRSIAGPHTAQDVSIRPLTPRATFMNTALISGRPTRSTR